MDFMAASLGGVSFFATLLPAILHIASAQGFGLLWAYDSSALCRGPRRSKGRLLPFVYVKPHRPPEAERRTINDIYTRFPRDQRTQIRQMAQWHKSQTPTDLVDAVKGTNVLAWLQAAEQAAAG